jgi:Ulp1 family protease
MFVFPFGLIGRDQERIDAAVDAAAKGLNELDCASLSRVIHPTGKGSNTNVKTSPDDKVIDLTSFHDAKIGETDQSGRNKRAYWRANSIIIREQDKARLHPHRWLNDTLIDFWMQWYVASPH